jgi:mono/diheme cytochrome c family protein
LSRTRAGLVVAFSALGALLAACSGTPIEEHPCPPGGTSLTYDNFGKHFFEGWCVQCHGAANGYSSRSYTSLELIRADRARIFVNAADDNTTMPPGPEDPPKGERQKLGEWLACGAP